MSISYDAVSSVSGVTNNTYSWTHIIGPGSNRLLWVAPCVEDAGTANPGDVPGTSVTYNGVGCTLQTRAVIRSGATALTEGWDMLEANLPSAGSYTIAVTHTGTIDEYNSGAISLANVKQQVPEAEATQTTTAGTTISQSVTTISNNAWILSAAVHGNTATSTPDSGTERFDVTNTSATGTATTEAKATAGAITIGFTFTGAGNRSAQVIDAYEEAAAAGSGNPWNYYAQQ